MTRIKICGLTNLDDARAALAFGADALGFVFAESPRRLTPETAREIIAELTPFVLAVGVFVNEPTDRIRHSLQVSGCTIAQLHGEYSDELISSLTPYPCLRVVRVRDSFDSSSISHLSKKDALLLDAYVPDKAGGAGRTFDHTIARTLVHEGWRIIVAGGLDPANVADVVRTVRPYGVDVSSGVEASPGRKNHQKLARFIAAVRAADKELTR